MLNRIIYNTEDVISFFANLHKVPTENVKVTTANYEEFISVDVPAMEETMKHPRIVVTPKEELRKP